MREKYPEHQVVTDIGSGINFKRKGLHKILEAAMSKSLKQVVVAHQDRLCRFAFDLIEWILEQNGAELLVLDHEAHSPETEFTEDLLSIVHVFSCRFNGMRSYEAGSRSSSKAKRRKTEVCLPINEPSEPPRQENPKAKEDPERKESEIFEEKKRKIPFQRKNPTTGLLRSRKIELDLTPAQKRVFKGWMGTARYAYNQALNLVKNEKHKPNFMALRNNLVPEKNIPQETKWQLLTPKDVRAEAIRDLAKAYASNFAKRKKTQDHRFDVHYRKKNEEQSISLSKAALSLEKDSRDRIKIYPRLLGKEEASVKLREALPSLALESETRKFLFDTRLLLERGKWYLCVPYELKEENDSQASLSVSVGGIVSLDPGVRTFQTAYSPDGVAYKFGQGDISRIIRLGKYADRLQSKLTKKSDENYPETHRRKRRFVYKVKKALQRLKGKIKDLVKELHCKLASFLCRNFKMILIPEFPTSTMSNRLKRRIGSRTV